MKDARYGLICNNSMWKAWDESADAELNVEDVKAARALEMEYVLNMRVCGKVARSELKRTGGKLIVTRWVDVIKGDALSVDCRSRLVGREFNVSRDDALYAATPPLEALRLIVSDAATIGVDYERTEVVVNDLRRAHLYAKIERDVFMTSAAK